MRRGEPRSIGGFCRHNVNLVQRHQRLCQRPEQLLAERRRHVHGGGVGQARERQHHRQPGDRVQADRRVGIDVQPREPARAARGRDQYRPRMVLAADHRHLRLALRRRDQERRRHPPLHRRQRRDRRARHQPDADRQHAAAVDRGRRQRRLLQRRPPGGRALQPGADPGADRKPLPARQRASAGGPHRRHRCEQGHDPGRHSERGRPRDRRRRRHRLRFVRRRLQWRRRRRQRLPGIRHRAADQRRDQGPSAERGAAAWRRSVRAGNHEYYTPSALGYFDYFNGQGNVSGIAGNTGAGWYSFNVGAWHVIALNSNCELNSVDEEVIPGGCGAGSPEEQWLEQDLAGDHAACTLAYWHHPLFHSGNEPGGDAMKQMFTDLYNAHATLVLNAHEHQYERFAPQDPNGNLDPTNGIVEFVVGTGGRNLESFGTIAANSVARNNTNYGGLQLTLHPTSYDFQFVPQSGGTFTDSGSGKCRNLKAVDQTRPTSSASSPATTNSSTWKVSYTAADNSGGVGVESVDLYAKAPGQSTYTDVASDNSGSDSGSFTYNASAGDGTYSFYTIATDYAGNVQSTPSSPQATTLLDTVAPQSFAHAPATTSDAAWTVTYTAADNSGGSGLARVDLYARAPGQSSYTNVASNTSGAGSGSFSYTASGGTGTYSFYTLATDKAGNTEAKSSADTVTLLTRAPTTTTVSAPRTGAPGTRIMPGGISAAFSTGSGSPSGAIAFTVFGPQDSPPTSCSSGGTSLGSANVTGNGTYHPSTSFTPTSAGTYWWYAAYTGDGSHSPSDSGCGQGMASTAVSNPTTMRAAGPATAIARLPIPPVSVAAQLSGASAAAGGSITFRVLGPASTPPGSCAGRSLGRTSVHGDGVYHPPSAFTPSRGGTYWWYAAYDGDRTDAPSASTCGRLMATTSVYSVTSVAHSVQSARSARRATSSRFKVDPSTTYLLAVYRESAAGDTIARIESVGIRLSLARASFTHLVTMHHGPRTWEWVYYLRTPPSASGTGALSLSFSKAAATVTILDLLAVDDAGTSAPVIAGGRGMSRADGRGPFVKLPAPPATAGAWLAFLSAGQDEGSSPPLSFPQTRSVFYSHRRLGSAAVYGAMPGAPAEWFRLPASAGWAGIGLALGRQ